MNRYFFHIHSGPVVVPDLVGADLVDLDAAKDRALAEAESLAQFNASLRRHTGKWVEVTDQYGRILLSVRLDENGDRHSLQ